MPSNSHRSIDVRFSDEFKRNLRHLAKKYRHIKADIQPVIDQLDKDEKPGDQVPGVQYEVFKVRVKSTDAKKGKSGGYRIIYYVAAEDKIFLVTIYSKAEQEDVSPVEIRQIIKRSKAEESEASEAGHDTEHEPDEGDGES